MLCSAGDGAMSLLVVDRVDAVVTFCKSGGIWWRRGQLIYSNAYKEIFENHFSHSGNQMSNGSRESRSKLTVSSIDASKGNLSLPLEWRREHSPNKMILASPYGLRELKREWRIRIRLWTDLSKPSSSITPD